MKSLIISGLSVLVLTTVSAQNVRAQEVATSSATFNSYSSTSHSKVTSFDLVNQAIHADFKAEGIPGYQALNNAYYEGEITARQIVAAAINANQLSPNYLNDQSYIDAVDTQLRYGLTIY